MEDDGLDEDEDFNGMENDDDDTDGGEDREDNDGNDITGDDEDIDDEDTDIDDEDDDDIEDDDDDDEDDDDEDDNDDEIEDDEEYRRRFRRKRRIRNQVIAYGVVIIFAALLVSAGVFAGQKAVAFISERRSMQAMSEPQEPEEPQPADLVIEAPPEIEEATIEEQIDEIVNTCIEAMPLTDKVAGLFIVAPEAITGVSTVIQAGEGTQDALSQYAVGGLVYSTRNIQDKDQLMQMLANTMPMSKYPIFLAIEEEGGDYSKIAESGIEIAQVDNMSVIGESNDTSLAYESGLKMGSYLSELGFNLNLAPAADVVSDAESSIVGDRSFGADASIDADMVFNTVQGMEGAGVSACLKHFPGIGSVEKAANAQGGVPTIDKTLEEMRSSDFIPFRKGIEAGVDMIMVSNAAAPELDDSGVPSSMSYTVISDILRGELGYNGIVITDALNQEEIAGHYSSDEAAIAAIKAGADMLLMPEDFETAYEGLLTAAENGTISEERIDESLRRIYRIKYADRVE